MLKCISVAVAGLFIVAAVQAQAPRSRPQLTPEAKAEIQKKLDWVKATEAEDFAFWQRYANMPDQNAFRQPQEWYNPMALVDGGLAPFLPVAGKDEAPTIDPAAIEKVSAYAFERETQALYVYHRGKVRYQRFMDGYGPTSAISSHSWVKTLHGILTGFALKDGKIKSLDDPIENYIAEWKGDPRGKITVRQVLQNTSGLEVPDQNEPDPRKSLGLQLVEGTDMDKTVLAHKLVHKPGEAFAHNNVNTQLMGMILRHATGITFDKYLSQKLWQPIVAQRGALRRDKNYGGNIISYCCFLSAPSDWLRVAHLLM